MQGLESVLSPRHCCLLERCSHISASGTCSDNGQAIEPARTKSGQGASDCGFARTSSCCTCEHQQTEIMLLCVSGLEKRSGS